MVHYGFATRLLETGTRDPETRSYMLGHRVKSMTGVYTHISFDMVKEAIKRLQSIVPGENASELAGELDKSPMSATMPERPETQRLAR